MPETTIYRGPSGTTIDASALEIALAKQDMQLVFHRDRAEVPMPTGIESHFETLPQTEADPCRAEIVKCLHGTPLTVLDSEEFPAKERVEGTAQLLRRVLPEPAKVIAHMTDEADAA